MNLDTIIVDSLLVIKTKSTPKTFDVPSRPHHSLSYRLAGQNTIYSGDKTITSNADTLTLVPAGVAYRHDILTPSEQIVAHFTTKDCIGDIVENITLPPQANAKQQFWQLFDRWEIVQKESDLQCMAIFYGILASIAKYIAPNHSTKKEKLLEGAISQLHAHYRDSEFSLSDLSLQSYISQSYFRRIFREVYGCAPIDYLKRLRINYAKRLLDNGYYTISEISELSGFSSPTYFSFEFKNSTGLTPTEYRQNNVK